MRSFRVRSSRWPRASIRQIGRLAVAGALLSVIAAVTVEVVTTGGRGQPAESSPASDVPLAVDSAPVTDSVTGGDSVVSVEPTLDTPTSLLTTSPLPDTPVAPGPDLAVEIAVVPLPPVVMPTISWQQGRGGDRGSR